MLRFGSTYIFFLVPHQKSGDCRPVARKKAGWAGRRPLPMGLFIGIDEAASEGDSLVNPGPHPD